MTEDPLLLRRFAKERREEDFAELVRRHLGLVYQAALRRTNGDTHLAEDVAQQVFTKLAQCAGEVTRHPVLAGWLYVTTRHAAANAMRSAERRRWREQEAQLMNELITTDNFDVEWDRLRPELDRVMDELPERDRHAVLLRYFENKPFAQIGAILHLSENAARMRVDRALERLRAALEKRGIPSTSAALAALLANQAAAAAPDTLATTITASVFASGAAVAASSGIIAFMTTTKILSAAATAVCVVAGFILSVHHEAVRLQAVSVATLQQGESATAELTEAHAKAGQLRQRNAELLEKRNALKSQLAERMAAKKATASLLSELLLYSDPEYQRRWFEQMRLDLRKRYAFFYKKLSLTPQQIEEFEKVQSAAQQSAVALRGAILARGIDPGDPTFNESFKEESRGLEAARDAKLGAILGEAGLATYTAFENNPKRVTAEMLAMDLYYSATPLSTGQMLTLDELIFSTTTKEENEVDWEKIFSAAKVLLQPAQLEALEKCVERQKTSQRMVDLRNGSAIGGL